MITRPNRPTLESVRHTPIGELLALPAEHLALLQQDAREAVEAAKRMQDWIEGVIARRYADRAAEARRAAGKDTGTIRLQDGEVEIVADLPKKVTWDQPKLAEAVATLRGWGEDPADYVTTELRVPEVRFNAWPPRIRALFEPARTVAAGRPSYSLARKDPA
ncbi:hypothetical protein [Elioraea tepidiphila]|jgi:hypothetical protein|uniref:hypothetical protein n=1 Tax=Elioraea tepidiphila TaxID=457934 RepID=UPI002FDA30AF